MLYLKQNFSYWKIIAGNTLQSSLVDRWTTLLYLLGKTVRIGMSLVFLGLIKSQISNLAGYNGDQLIVFFIIYQLLDTFVQIFFRGVYEFESKVRSGDFDLSLTQPINPLFRSLMGKPDINDAVLFVPLAIISAIILTGLDLNITAASLAWSLIFVINGILISTALHILILCLGVVALEVNSAIWVYRDLSRLGQFPIVIYTELIRFVLNFVVPIGIMVGVPAQLLFGGKPSVPLVSATLVGVVFLVGSLWVWKKSLKKYSSASS